MTYTALPAHHGDPNLPRGHFVHSLEAGSEVTDAVRVYNLTTQPTTFDVYAGDLIERDDGGSSPAGRHEEVTGSGAWITTEVGTITIPPRSSELVPFTIAVPTEAAQGTHPAALLVERQGAEPRGPITTRARIALRVELEVLGEIDLGVQLGALERSREDGAVRFDLPVSNTGTVTFAADGAVLISRRAQSTPTEVALGPAGQAVAPDGTVVLHGLWDAPMFGRVTAQPVVEATVGERPARQFVGEAVTFWLVPWSHLLLALALVALVIALLVATRDRRRTWRQHHREERHVLRDFREERKRREAGTRDQPPRPALR
jgi:hypothetical protein